MCSKSKEGILFSNNAWKNRFERTLSRHIADQFPGVDDVRIERLELHHAFVRTLFEVFLGIETLLGRLDTTRESSCGEREKDYLVEREQVANGWRFGAVFWKDVLHVRYQHAELCAPITDMVQSKDVEADVLEQTRDAVTDNRRSRWMLTRSSSHWMDG